MACLEYDRLQGTLRGWFEWFHRHPETAFQEFETTAKIKEILKRIPNAELLDLGLETGVLAKIGGKPDGPVVAVRADIDALPITEQTNLAYASERDGCMHACGHDFHTTALLGAAELLGGQADSLYGSVILLFQPAEETVHGAEKVVSTGLFEREKIRQIFGLHVRPSLPVGTIAVGEGVFAAAVDRFLITVTGSGCHGSAPEKGLDPIPAAARLIGSLQEIVSRRISTREAAVVSVTRISAGTSWNIIPDSAELEGTVRSFRPEVRQAIEENIRRYVGGLQDEGYEVDLQWIPGCPATNNDGKLSELVAETARDQGFEVAGLDPSMGGEDFSYYQELVPGAFFKVGTGIGYPVHNAKFAVDPAALAPAARLMAEIVKRALRR